MKKVLFFVFFMVSMYLYCLIYNFSEIQLEIPEGFSTDIVKNLIGYKKLMKDKKINTQEMKSIEKKLLESGYFQTFDIKIEKGKLVISVTPNPIIKGYKISGNHIIKTKKIKKYINKIISKNKYYSYFTQTDIEKKIKELYQKKGLYEIEVKIKEELQEENNQVFLNILINEKDIYKIKKIHIRGNNFFSKRKIKKIMLTKQSWFFKTHYYYPELLSYDIDRIKRTYMNAGFLDIKIIKKIKKEDKNRCIYITLLIDEGKRYKIGSLEIYGNTLFTDEEIKNVLKSLKYKYFSYERWIKDDAANVFNLYANEGLLNTQVSTRYIKLSQKGIVNLEIKIDEGKRYKVGKVTFVRPPLNLDNLTFWDKLGIIISPPIKEKILKYMFDIQEGDIYKKYKVERGYQNLINSRLFENVELQGEPTEYQVSTIPYLSKTLPGSLGKESGKKNSRDISVFLQEKSTGRLILSAGVGEDVGGFGQITYSELNLFGMAHKINLSAIFGTEYTSFYTSYLIPYFRDKKHFLSAKIYNTTYAREDYDEKRTGVKISYGKRINDYLTLAYGIKLARINVDTDDDLQDRIDITHDTYKKLKEFDSYDVRGPVITIKEDTRDNYIFPTKGYIQQHSLELLGLFGGEVLPTFSSDFRFYKKLRENLVVATQFRFDTIIKNVDDIPIPERLYLGGLRTVRGFAFRGAGEMDDIDDDLPLGGNSRFVLRSEIRKRFTKMFTMSLFIDSGVLGKDNPFDWNEGIKVGTGIGFLFHLPIGDISIDVAKALNADSDDETQTIHFNIGFTY